MGKLLNGVPDQVRVEGPTDNEPVRQRRFASNWELSVARAVQVLHGLESAGVARHRLSAAGFADQRPLVSNRTSDGRRMNRRVDLVVLRGGLL